MQAVPSPSRAHFDFLPSISTLCLALPRWLPGLKSANGILGYLSCILSDLASLFTLFHFFILSFFFCTFFSQIFSSSGVSVLLKSLNNQVCQKIHTKMKNGPLATGQVFGPFHFCLIFIDSFVSIIHAYYDNNKQDIAKNFNKSG